MGDRGERPPLPRRSSYPGSRILRRTSLVHPSLLHKVLRLIVKGVPSLVTGEQIACQPRRWWEERKGVFSPRVEDAPRLPCRALSDQAGITTTMPTAAYHPLPTVFRLSHTRAGRHAVHPSLAALRHHMRAQTQGPMETKPAICDWTHRFPGAP